MFVLVPFSGLPISILSPFVHIPFSGAPIAMLSPFVHIPFSGAPIAMLSPVSWKGCSGSQAPAWLEASSQAQLTSQQPWAMPWKYFRLRCWHRPSASTCTRAVTHEKHCIRRKSRVVCKSGLFADQGWLQDQVLQIVVLLC